MKKKQQPEKCDSCTEKKKISKDKQNVFEEIQMVD